jgi:hypothetical protein
MAHTPPAAVKKPTEESTRERDLGVSVGRDSRYGSIYVCPPLPPGPRALVLPPSSSFPPLSPPDPTPSIRLNFGESNIQPNSYPPAKVTSVGPVTAASPVLQQAADFRLDSRVVGLRVSSAGGAPPCNREHGARRHG